MRAKKGFTLVELSIVIVIVGLLIGGILIAKSMIETSRLQKLISTIQQYEIAVDNFKTVYNNALPGDTTILSIPNSLPGHIPRNDGMIYSACQYFATNLGGNTGEAFNFWHHLSRSNILQQQFSGYTGFTSFSGSFASYAPSLSYGDVRNCYLNASTVTSTTACSGDQAFGNAWIIAGEIPSSPQYARCIGVNQAQALDAKLDDALPQSGNIQLGYPYSGPRLSGDGAGACGLSTYIKSFTSGCILGVKANW